MSDELQTGLHALLVDDNEFSRKLVRRILTTAGIETISEAEDGRAAFTMLQQSDLKIDIIFCDLMMPDMDGVQFMRHAESLPVSPSFVFVSAASDTLLATVESAGRARNLRILGCTRKPFTLDAARRFLIAHERSATAEDSPKRASYTIGQTDILHALKKNELHLHFQPKVALESKKLVGFESLARWTHPEHGNIPPDVFIAAAEQHDLIGALTERTTSLAMQHCSEWRAVGLTPKVSINLSAYMLVDVDFPQRLADEAATYRIEPEQIILEITESGLFKDVANTLEILARLKMKGFELSIDDFGTGYSSLQQLSRVPFTEIKIDRAFVNGSAKNKKARAILETSVDLARKLDLTVVAEGAETQEDWDILAEVGVDIVQGYFISRPMPAEQVIPWCTK